MSFLFCQYFDFRPWTLTQTSTDFGNSTKSNPNQELGKKKKKKKKKKNLVKKGVKILGSPIILVNMGQ